MKKLKLTLILLGILFISIYGIKYTLLQIKMNEIIKSDERNQGIDVSVKYDLYINPNIIHINIKNVSSDRSFIDVTRVLLQFSKEKLKSNYEKVYLDFRGTSKFFMKGDYFKQLGVEYGTQNNLYTIRTMPENLYLPTGQPAFTKWEGGVLAVATKQMEDFSEFHKNWYLISN